MLFASIALLAACGCSRTGRAQHRAAAAADAGGPVPCGALSCAQYDDARGAVLAILEAHPRVLAVGEAHAPKGAEVPSSAVRFTRELLPSLAGRASDLLVELMMPPQGCEEATHGARDAQAPVTSRQAPTDQSEYLAMGDAARDSGIVPDMLRPTCDDMRAIAAAGDETIDVSLRTIARLTAQQAEHLVDRDAHSEADRDKMVVVYGGALHNDLPRPAGPSPEASPWSYAVPLDAAVSGRLVAIDLIVPEFIGDDTTWRSLPWRPHYDRRRLGAKVTLFRTGERSYTLVFAESSGHAHDLPP
jgi:hypothetical protein